MGRSPFSGEPQQNWGHRTIPILPSSTKPMDPTHGDRMDLTPPTSATMGPPVHSSPEMDHPGSANGTFGEATHAQNGPAANGLSAAAATSSQQPKVVQTAFIHKLYKWAAFAVTLTTLKANGFLVCWKIQVYQT